MKLGMQSGTPSKNFIKRSNRSKSSLIKGTETTTEIIMTPVGVPMKYFCMLS